ncbi:hypothetical protein F442_21680 [Phytophthora nicotianae P10297]|uniref:RanBP2-type domain-containing protein n=1 Tax=Phytophthora nicotianae P10297 TaxID=1317064 RepID=W2Y1Y6_PHYNI|nr:hypothetical protein F442_21680 [Phytophthora nicotianae P10297]
MQSGRRRLRQRSERKNESVDSSSDSDVELVTKVEGVRPHSQELKTGIAENAWECRMCTFLNEDTRASRCELCESARPGLPRKTRKLSQWLSQPMNKTEHNSSTKKQSSGASMEPIEVIDSSESGNSDDDASVTSAASYNGEATLLRRSNGKVATAKTNQGLWTDLYAPKTVDDLCVNKKKVQEISEWLDRNASPQPGVFQKRLLFLCGPPGSGKSTAVRCIARQLGLLIKEWEDNSAAGKLNYERMLREDFWTPQISGVDDFSDFIHRSSAYAALPVATSRHASSIGGKCRLSSTQPGSGNLQKTGQVILIESWPESWSKDKSLYEEKLQRIYQHVVDPAGGCRYPVVCIYSDVQGSKIDLDHLSRKFSREVMHSPLTSVININAVTSVQLKKHLTRITAQENCPFQPADIQNIIDSSNGDMRHALNMLQLSLNPNVKKHKAVSATTTKKGKRRRVSSANSEASTAPSASIRDPFLSDFHVVGKLLHGKMLANKNADESALRNGANTIDYDQILDASAMPLDRVLALVHENSIAYFTQVEDLSGALDLMSLCEVLVAESYSGVRSSEAFKRSRGVAQAILMRTVAVTNENPAPKAFRPITRPQTYTAKQRIVSRREEMLVATRGGKHGLQHACTGDVFAFEVEPFLTIMDRVGGPATRQNAAGTLAIDSLSLKEEVDDEIENSDDEW